MKVEVVRRFSEAETLDMIRRVPLLEKVEGEDVFPYQASDINLRRLRPKSVNPTTFYLLNKNLAFQRELRRVMLQEFDIDSLDLESAVEISVDKGDPRVLFPAVLEETEVPIQAFGDFSRRAVVDQGELEYEHAFQRITVPIINDGMHRMWLADKVGLDPRVVYVSGANKAYPFYAYPNSWGKINVVDETPREPGKKKFYRLENPKPLYRNFGVFNGSTMREGGARSG